MSLFCMVRFFFRDLSLMLDQFRPLVLVVNARLASRTKDGFLEILFTMGTRQMIKLRTVKGSYVFIQVLSANTDPFWPSVQSICLSVDNKIQPSLQYVIFLRMLIRYSDLEITTANISFSYCSVLQYLSLVLKSYYQKSC